MKNVLETKRTYFVEQWNSFFNNEVNMLLMIFNNHAALFFFNNSYLNTSQSLHFKNNNSTSK